MMQKFEHIEKNVLGMALFLLNEIVFFALLIIAFINYQANRVNNPGPANSLHPGVTAIYTVFLLASSGTIFMADRSLERKNNRGVSIWLVATVVLGGVFLVGQGIEYFDLLSNHITPATNLFGTTFFSLTGFHGLHVFVGLIMLAILAGFAFTGEFKSGKSSAIGAISLYWHFVDVVWIAIFTLIYIWGAGVIKF
jgi:heme/copper-type cytochrome/quinol oxidase subunit 3